MDPLLSQAHQVDMVVDGACGIVKRVRDPLAPIAQPVLGDTTLSETKTRLWDAVSLDNLKK